jgi:hypothetical protein
MRFYTTETVSHLLTTRPIPQRLNIRYLCGSDAVKGEQHGLPTA